MLLENSITKRILQLCDERRITANKLATLSGLPPSTVNNIILKKSKSPTIKSIYLICQGLNISITEFFNADYMQIPDIEEDIKMSKKFGNILQELREDNNLSQQELGEILNFTGQTISYWELNKREPDIETLIKIAKYFDVTLDYLCGKED